MAISINKTVATSVALFLMLTMAVTLVAVPLANAHDPPWTLETYAYIAVSPNPVGVGQSVIIVMWVHGAPPTAAGLAGDRWHDFNIKVTKPNRDTQNLGPFVSDPTGSKFTTYTPDQAGTYTFDFSYTGQVMTLVNPETGVVANPADLVPFADPNFVNDTFLGSSASTTLTVQEDPIEKIPDYPLPTEYWTRPIEGQNSAWATVASNWLRGAQLGHPNLWQMDGVAPNSAHIMWTKPIEFGGIVGGTTQIPEVGFYSGGSYEGRFGNAIIMAGRLYYQEPLGHSGGAVSSSAGYNCVDLRTGEVLWSSDVIGVESAKIPPGGVLGHSNRAAMKGQLFDYESINQHGVVGGIIWEMTGSKWIAYDGFTGKWMFNLTNVPVGYEVYTDKGEIVRYVLNYNTTSKSGWMALWNNTQDNVGLHLAAGTTTNAYQWRPNGKSVDMSIAYSWNVTISADLSGLGSPTILYAIPGDIILGTSAVWPTVGGIFTVQQSPITMWAISDKPGTRGNLLWLKDITLPESTTRLAGPVDTVNRVFTMTNVETMAWLGFDLDSGTGLWGPEIGVENAFSYYGSGRGGGQVGFFAYGNLYTQGFGGEICCFDGATGTLLWRYNNTNSGDETAWGNYPIFIAAIADGKVYAFNNEHSPNYPLYKGERVRCINATTGEEIWTLLSWAGQIGGGGESTAALAEGFLSYYNYYDNQVYCIGKGPSATSVTTSPKISANGDNILIEGTVIDTATGTKQDEQIARFPNGVPAMSDESMGEWMEYVYMQKPCPQNAVGVDVLLQTLDPNGNFYDIGTVTTDSTGMYKLMWEPPVPGEYTIIATFQGSESYWPSYAETAIGVTEASPTPPPEEPLTLPPTDMYVLATGIAIIIAIAIAILILRKR